MADSKADQHDKDKLERWQSDLGGGVTGGFPLHALFLVSEVDRAAHDVFRFFRSRFQELGAEFHHLVIFGQHGVSQAEQTLLELLGLTADAIPSLVLLTASIPPLLYTLPLVPGDVKSEAKDSLRAPWRLVLEYVELAAADARESDDQVKVLALSNIPGIRPGIELSEHVGDLVVRTLGQLN